MTDESGTVQSLDASFEKALNAEGYPFQYLVYGEFARLFKRRRSSWVFVASEFPVRVQGQDTRIDLIFRHKDRPHFMVVECKRANPRLARWCFVEAPATRRNRTFERFIADHVRVGPGVARAVPEVSGMAGDAYHIALELKTEKRGDAQGSGRGGIERATTQVLRGLNGLVQYMVEHPQVLKGASHVVITPAIVTTAEVYSSPVVLTEGDVKEGTVLPGSAVLESKDWLVYQYHQSPGLKYDTNLRPKPSGDLGEVLEVEFIRTVPIVTPAGLRDYLMWIGARFEDDFENAS